MRDHHRALRDLFLQRLLELKPRSVLDLGCGEGPLLAGLQAAGVWAIGVEPEVERAAVAQAAGHRILSASGERLPFADGAFDWVTLRHVPHHLERPRESLAEAWRVARAGLLLAEPWFDLRFASQRAGDEADRLLKRLDRARGMYHGERFEADELVALLPPTPRRVECRTHVDLEPWPESDLQARRVRARGEGNDLPEDANSWARVLRSGPGRNGTLIVCAWR